MNNVRTAVRLQASDSGTQGRGHWECARARGAPFLAHLWATSGRGHVSLLSGEPGCGEEGRESGGPAVSCAPVSDSDSVHGAAPSAASGSGPEGGGTPGEQRPDHEWEGAGRGAGCQSRREDTQVSGRESGSRVRKVAHEGSGSCPSGDSGRARRAHGRPCTVTCSANTGEQPLCPGAVLGPRKPRKQNQVLLHEFALQRMKEDEEQREP